RIFFSRTHPKSALRKRAVYQLRKMDEEFLDEQHKQVPNLDLTQLVFRCEIAAEAEETAQLRAQMMAAVEEDKMAPYYDYLCTNYGWVRDDQLYNRLMYVAAQMRESV